MIFTANLQFISHKGCHGTSQKSAMPSCLDNTRVLRGHGPIDRPSFFPRASERSVLLIVGVCQTFSHRHSCSSSHLLIFTSSHLHILSPSHLLIFRSAHLYTFSSSHLHKFSSSHILIFTSSHLHIFSSSHLHILTSSHPHVFTSSHLHILSCPLALLLPPAFLFLS